MSTVFDRLARRAETAATIGLAVLFAGLLVAETAGLASEHRSWAFDLAVGIVVCTIALLRGRNRPWAAVAGLIAYAAATAVAGVSGLPNQPAAAATVALLVLGASAVRTAPARVALGIALAGAAVVVAGRTIGSPFPPGSEALIGVLIWAAALGVGLWLRYLDAARHGALEAVRRDERLSMARELHDVVAHHVTAMVVQAQAARLVAPKQPKAVGPALAGIEAAGSEALAAMHRLVGLLRDPDDAPSTAPGPEQLSELVARFANHGPAVTLRLPADGSEGAWPPEIAATIYRVVQESLTNVVRHAPDAHVVTVAVSSDARAVSVEVADDAPATTARPRRSGGYGLAGMRERVEVLGGTLQAGPHTGAGWCVQATLPLASTPGT